MNPTRRSQVINLLQRQARLERDQMADEHAKLVNEHDKALDSLDVLNQAQAAAHTHLRQFMSVGAVINPDLYRSVSLDAVARTSTISSAENDVDTAGDEVDAMRHKLRQHEEKIKKLAEIKDKEIARQGREEAIAEINVNDALWLSRRGVQK